jgi:hypothetical protein
MADLEGNGNHNDCVFVDYEHDECDGNDTDGGLIVPASYDFFGGGVGRCSDAALPNLPGPCTYATWGTDIDIHIDNLAGPDMFLNVLADWDGSGDWGQVVTCPDGTIDGDEHIIQDVPVPGGFVGPASLLGLGSTPVLSDNGFVWFRFVLSDGSVVGPDAWTGEGQFGDGETEDYLLAVGELTAVPQNIRTGSAIELQPAVPNPFNPTVTIGYLLAKQGSVRIMIHDAAGRVVRTVERSDQPEGAGSYLWDGRDDAGRRLHSGVFLVQVVSGGSSASQKVVMLK